jgi:peptidyl-prolyl cis-trans isomerase D
MLKLMRSHKFFTVFLLSAVTVMIIITFIFWGIGPNTNPSAGIVAEIENERVTLDEYWRAYDNEYKRLREIYPNEEEIEKLNLKERVLDSLIDRKVLLIAARKVGILVTDNELQEVIINNPYFQRNGVFDRDVYIRALRLNRMTPQIFEAQLKNDLMLTKMSRLIGETAELTAEETKMLDTIKGDKSQLMEVFFATKSNQAIKAYVEGLKRKMKIKINWDLIS